MLFRSGLGSSKEAQKFLAETVERLSNPYVPFSGGGGTHLKDHMVHVAPDGSTITYHGPYAHYQYFGEIMGPNIPLKGGGFISPVAPKTYTGRPLEYHGAPMRGKEWDKRMMSDRGDEITEALAKKVGGKAK